MGAERTENASGEYGGMEGDLRNLKNSKYPDSPPRGIYGSGADRKCLWGIWGDGRGFAELKKQQIPGQPPQRDLWERSGQKMPLGNMGGWKGICGT